MIDSLFFNILLFLTAFLITLYSGDKLSFYAKLLGAKSKISDFIIGTLLLSVITSLPELSSGLSAVFFVKNPNLMIADVFGSNFFNVTVLWVSLLLVILFNFKLRHITKSHAITAFYSIIIPIILLLEFELYKKGFLWISFASLIFIMVIPFSIKFFINIEESHEDNISFDNKYLKYTKLRILIIFLFYSLLIIFSGLLLAQSSDFIAKYKFILNGQPFYLGSSFVGGLFLAISTSLPEVTVTFYSIFKYKSINLAYGNILGSNLFNTFIFLLGDIFTKTPLIQTITMGNIFIIAGVTFSTLFFIFEKKLSRTLKIVFSIVFIIFYVVILTLTFGQK